MNNPYAAPNADLTRVVNDGQTYVPQMFSMKGRIGRVRYLSYSMVLALIVMLFVGILTGVLAAINPVLVALAAIGYVPALAVSFIMAVRRLNDLDQRGWWSVLIIIPIVNIFLGLWLLFGRGSDGSNRFGPAPSPNTRMIVLGAWLPMVVIAIFGILAAIAVPAYMKYKEKARDALEQMEKPAAPVQQEQV